MKNTITIFSAEFSNDIYTNFNNIAEAVIPSFVGPITMEIGGLHDLHQIDSITQLSDSKENGQLHRNKENSTVTF